MSEWFALIADLFLNEIPRLGLVLILYAILGLIELENPAEKGHKGLNKLRNVGFAGIFIFGGLIVTSIVYFFIPTDAPTSTQYSFPISLFLLFVYLFLFDFLFYWYHRAEHTFSFLWPIHELHHSDEELNVTTSMRTYWLELPVQTLLISIPTHYFIGLDYTAAGLLPIIFTFWLLITHANIKFYMGPLSAVVCGPQVHRIHHSNLPHHKDKNFAQFFPIIDVLFGTYYKPAKNEYPSTGTEGLSSKASYKTTLTRPFKLWSGLFQKI